MQALLRDFRPRPWPSVIAGVGVVANLEVETKSSAKAGLKSEDTSPPSKWEKFKDALGTNVPDTIFQKLTEEYRKGADKPNIFRFMESLKMIVRATSLGDVHTMILYPAMASHRDLSPKHRERLGIHDNLVRMSIGIEAIEDILADLDQAFTACN